MEELYYWIALRFVFGIGKVNYKNLINHFGSPANVLQAHLHELKQVEGVNAKAIEAIRDFQPGREIEQELKLIKANDIKVITLHDYTYPENLKNIYDPPPFLYVKTSIRKEDNNAIAIVGSRNPSEYGTITTERISRELALCGLTIVSGMARGIDSAAHYGALAARGRTIAVLGSGLDVIYPPENSKLYESIVSSGAVVSEFPMGTRPHGYNFPARNRIISGLSLGVLVVEASLKSGSLITARLALEQGREVFAIPGNVHSYKSKGTHRLLKEGARLVESAQDILDELRLDAVVSAKAETLDNSLLKMDAACRSVYQTLQDEPRHIDEVILATGMTSSQAAAILLDLELNGFIRQLPGKRFIKAVSKVK